MKTLEFKERQLAHITSISAPELADLVAKHPKAGSWGIGMYTSDDGRVFVDLTSYSGPMRDSNVKNDIFKHFFGENHPDFEVKKTPEQIKIAELKATIEKAQREVTALERSVK